MKRLSSAYVSLVVALTSMLTCATSCRTEQSIAQWSWADVDALLATHAEQTVQDAPAVIVLRDQRFLFQTLGLYGDGRSEVHTHEVTQIITEAGFEEAQMKLFWPKKGKLVHLDARSIAPDGTITPLDTTELFASEVKIDTGGEKQAEVEARFFSFPRVEVGSFIEVAYTTTLPGLYSSWSERIADDLPILDYRIELAVDDVAEPDLRILNSDIKPRIETRDRMQHISFQMKNVPAVVDESYAPSWRVREPWWIYRTVAYRFPNQLFYMNGDWDDVTDQLLPMFKGKGLEGAPRADVASCNGDPVCTVTKCNELVRDAAAWSGFDRAFSHRDVSTIVAEKSASAADKALLLYAVLKDAGVDARLAGFARRGTNEVPRDFPSLTWLNHTMVVAVFGDKGALWIDPSCEHCTPGFMPSWVPIGEPALVVWAKDTARGKKHQVEWWAIAGQPMPIENVETRTYAVTLEDDGDAKVVLDETRTGESALHWRADTRKDSEDDRRRDARAAVQRLSRAALLDTWEPVTCVPAQGKCTRHLTATLPRFAHVGRDGVRVPFDLLRSVVHVTKDDEDEPRKTDFIVEAPVRVVDELRITAPSGKRIDGAPDAWSANGPLVDVSVSSTREGDVLVVKRETKLSAGKVVRADLAKIERVLERSAALHSNVVTIR
jgi:hypothetical protein